MHHCITTDDGQKILVVGGYWSNATVYWYSTLEIFDIDNKIWSQGPEFPIGFHGAGIVPASQNSQYVAYTLGGYTPPPRACHMTDIYGITKDLQNIVKIGDLAKGRHTHKAVALPSKITQNCNQQN